MYKEAEEPKLSVLEGTVDSAAHRPQAEVSVVGTCEHEPVA